MPVTSKIEGFLDVVRKSSLLERKRLQAYLERLEAINSLPEDPSQLANLMIREGLLSRLQAQQLLAGKFRGFMINGKYRILEFLGRGGMGRVYLCEHVLMKRLVALKVLPVEKGEQPLAVERFFREARAVVSLNHPNIVRAYDLDRDDKQHFIVMEHVDGSSLHDIVQAKGPMNPLRAAHYIAQAAAGLQHAHEAGWVHRDIKPGNLLLDRHGVVRILDMGLARVFNDKADMLTQKLDSGNPLGTADFVAPEQAMNSSAVDIRADIYGLGATFYLLLTSKPPFPEGSIAQKLMAHQLSEPRSIHEYRPDVPDEMVAIIEQMMSKDPEERLQTPADVVEALTPWTETPIPPPPPQEMPKQTPIVANLLQAKMPAGTGDCPSSGGLRPSLSGPLSSRSGLSGSGLRKPASSGTLRLSSTSAETKTNPTVRPGSHSRSGRLASGNEDVIQEPETVSPSLGERLRRLPGLEIVLDRLEGMDGRRRLVVVLTASVAVLTLLGALGLTSHGLFAKAENKEAAPAVNNNSLQDPAKEGRQVGADAAPSLPSTPAALLELGRTHACNREWNKAAACYAGVLRLEKRSDGHFWFEYAALLLLSGDRTGYRQVCAQMLEGAGKSTPIRSFHAARACTLAPDSVPDPARPGEVAEEELRTGVPLFWPLTEQAALHYRACRFAEALPLLEQSLEVEKKPGRAVLNWLWLALVNQRLGKAEEARRWLNQAAEWLDQYGYGITTVAEEVQGLHLHNWLEANILRREAEELLKTSPAARKP